MRFLSSPDIILATCAIAFVGTVKVATSAEGEKRSAKRPVVVLSLSSREFEVGDPLLAQVVFVNGTSRVVSLYTKYSAQTGLVQFRIQSDGEWKTIRAYGQGRASPRNAESELSPGESRATTESLFLDGDSPVFAEPGTFAIRAVVRCPPDEYSSESMTVKVQPSTPEKDAFLKTKSGLLSAQIWGGPSFLPFEFPLDVVGRLPDSQLRRQLLWDSAFYRWATDANADVDGAAWRELQELVPKLDAVNRERFQPAIAFMHHKHGRDEQALTALNALPDPTPSAIWLRGEIERGKRPAP